jgi:restriction system protein
MTNYFRVTLGQGGIHIEQGLREGFVGVDYEFPYDLSHRLPEQWQELNTQFVMDYQARHPEKSKIAVGAACGALWTFGRFMNVGDTVLTSAGKGQPYRIGEVRGEYMYYPGQVLPHRRPVKWKTRVLERSEMSDDLLRSIVGGPLVNTLLMYPEELAALTAERR